MGAQDEVKSTSTPETIQEINTETKPQIQEPEHVDSDLPPSENVETCSTGTQEQPSSEPSMVEVLDKGVEEVDKIDKVDKVEVEAEVEVEKVRDVKEAENGEDEKDEEDVGEENVDNLENMDNNTESTNSSLTSSMSSNTSLSGSSGSTEEETPVDEEITGMDDNEVVSTVSTDHSNGSELATTSEDNSKQADIFVDTWLSNLTAYGPHQKSQDSDGSRQSQWIAYHY